MAQGREINMQIRVETEQLSEISAKLHQERDQFAECVQRMAALIGQIPDVWAGASAESFVAQFEGLQPTFLQVEDLIDTIGVQAAEVVAAVSDLDASIAGVFG